MSWASLVENGTLCGVRLLSIKWRALAGLLS
jgi:hypothetical protein